MIKNGKLNSRTKDEKLFYRYACADNEWVTRMLDLTDPNHGMTYRKLFDVPVN